ncbi:DNA-binding protein, partial [Vibrio europaeus]|uniref:DNA-binding protein n=1 Tax=Vibrio europaeus TaxID=300876 RepID=UPI0016B73BE3
MEWFVVRDLMGFSGLPTTERGIRKLVENLAITSGVERRKRQGTKAFEYPISILSTAHQVLLLKKQGKVQVGEQVLELPKKKSDQSYCREALWARWSKNNNAAKEKAQQALRTVQAVFALKNNGIKLMDAYQSVSEEYGVALSTLRRSCA